jgi:hypothetical protein
MNSFICLMISNKILKQIILFLKPPQKSTNKSEPIFFYSKLSQYFVLILSLISFYPICNPTPQSDYPAITINEIRLNWRLVFNSFSITFFDLFLLFLRMMDIGCYYMFLVVDSWELIIEFLHLCISLMVHRNKEGVGVPLMNTGCFHC